MKLFLLKAALLFLVCIEMSCAKTERGDSVFNIKVLVNDGKTALAYKKIYCVSEVSKDVQRYSIYSEVTDNMGVATFHIPARTIAVGYKDEYGSQSVCDCQAFFELLYNDDIYYTKFYVQHIDINEEREYDYSLEINTQQKPPLIEE